MTRPLFTTDQTRCYDAAGEIIPCESTLQDGAFKTGPPWTDSRFRIEEEIVLDRLTGLAWTRHAAPAEFPLSWEEAFDYIREMNTERAFGFGDWRLPNRRELFSLVSHAHINPSLPADHPFTEVFSGYYWTATTCARLPGQAWYVHLGGARLFKGMKHGSYMVWPVRNYEADPILPGTGQSTFYAVSGDPIPCGGVPGGRKSKTAFPWPEPRFSDESEVITDHLTGLMWTRNADITEAPVGWETALEAVAAMNDRSAFGYDDWRLPNIRELESLTDMGAHSPAVASASRFENIREFYWSSTTSVYDPPYAWTLYTVDGNIGVGFKRKADFHVWPVRETAFGRGVYADETT
ncbi:MAG: DUF1566 domain-containing protein [Thermodesulfobacteriota bacterium]